jgi:hypothetical protein
MSASLAYRLAPVRETMFPSRAPLFKGGPGLRAAEIAAQTGEYERGNLTVSPDSPSLAHRHEARR